MAGMDPRPPEPGSTVGKPPALPAVRQGRAARGSSVSAHRGVGRDHAAGRFAAGPPPRDRDVGPDRRQLRTIALPGGYRATGRGRPGCRIDAVHPARCRARGRAGRTGTPVPPVLHRRARRTLQRAQGRFGKRVARGRRRPRMLGRPRLSRMRGRRRGRNRPSARLPLWSCLPVSQPARKTPSTSAAIDAVPARAPQIASQRRSRARPCSHAATPATTTTSTLTTSTAFQALG